MTYFDFHTTTHGKWILAGEHAVIRGHGALVFPMTTRTFELNYVARQGGELHVDSTGDTGQTLPPLFIQVLQQGFKLIGQPYPKLSGQFSIVNTLPVGAGMGASAALCVAVSRWFEAQRLIPNTTQYHFARQLENLFHGQSSGLDIAGVSTTEGVYFKQGLPEPMTATWQPHWFLSYCGEKGITAHCIEQVQRLWKDHAALAKAIDKQMDTAVNMAKSALTATPDNALTQLTHAIMLANDCFQQWGLVSAPLQNHMNQLMQVGAHAAKPTGSGNGGYVVSVWQTPPSQAIIEAYDLVPL